jgi:hypothetical protein
VDGRSEQPGAQTGLTPDASVEQDEGSTAPVPPVFQFPDGLGTADMEFVQATSTVLWAAVEDYLEGRRLRIPALTVLVTGDIMGAANDQGVRIGIGPDRRSGAERLPGFVGGKTLLSNDSTEAVVLLNESLLASSDGLARLGAAIALAHEISHVTYGVIRHATVGVTQDSWLPWEMAELMACGAAEEYRCDRLAIHLVDQRITATDDRGERIALARLVGAQYVAALGSALDALSPGLVDAVRRYRAFQMPLGQTWGPPPVEELWNKVAWTTEQVLLHAAHAEAYSDLDRSLLETIEHQGASLLTSIVAPLFQYLRATPVLPENIEWPQDRATLKRIGRDGLMAMWAQLGLHPRPNAEGFYLEVRDPTI